LLSRQEVYSTTCWCAGYFVLHLAVLSLEKPVWSTGITVGKGTDTAEAETANHTAGAADIKAEVEAEAEMAAEEDKGAGAGAETGIDTTAGGMSAALSAPIINSQCHIQQSSSLAHITAMMKSSSQSQADGPCKYMPSSKLLAASLRLELLCASSLNC
jgi:hypothetical protein